MDVLRPLLTNAAAAAVIVCANLASHFCTPRDVDRRRRRRRRRCSTSFTDADADAATVKKLCRRVLI